VTSGVAVRRGALGLGVLATYRAQSIVGIRSDASSVSAGLRLDLQPLEIGAALVDLPVGLPNRDISPSSLVVTALAANLAIAGEIHARIEIDAYAPGGRGSKGTFGASGTIRVAWLELRTGSSPLTGWGVGSAITWQRWTLEAAAGLRSRGQLNQHLAISIAYR
jgi:hypothetical protein